MDLLKNRKLVNDKNIVNTKSNESHKKLLPIAIICIAIVFTFIIALKPSIDLEDVVQPSMNISLIMTPNWYFFYNNHLIVYNYDLHGDQLYSTDLNANNKKIIAESENLRYANFFLVFNNEAYYYTEFHRGIKKVNLLNGDITSVVDNKYLYLIPNTLNESKVLVTYKNNYLYHDHVYIAELDLNTGLLDKEKYIKFPGNEPYFYNKDNNKVYYIQNDDSNRGNIYEDNEIIYSYSNSQYYHDIVFIQDNFIFAIIKNKIIKFDIITHSILEEKIFDTDLKYSLISNVRPGGATMLGNEEICMGLCVINDPVFNSDNNIYKFNSKMLTFEKIVDNANGSFVEKYNNYYIFQGDTREGPITTIYNSDNNNYKIFNSANYSVENGYIYMMTFKGDFYHQKYNNLKFKMKKISLDTI